MHTASYEFLMKPKESARCHQTLSARVGSGDETKREQAPINPLSPPSLAMRLRSERERAAYMRFGLVPQDPECTSSEREDLGSLAGQTLTY